MAVVSECTGQSTWKQLTVPEYSLHPKSTQTPSPFLSLTIPNLFPITPLSLFLVFQAMTQMSLCAFQEDTFVLSLH